MAAKKKVYWLGELVGKRRVGTIKVGGRLVKIGMSFTADSLDKDRLSVLRKAGCIGDAPFEISEPVGDDITLLQGKLSDLEDAAKVDGDKIAGLELENEELKKNSDVDSVKEIETLQNQVNELGSEVKRLTEVETDNKEKAALIKEQESEIKALKKAAKEAAK